MARILWSLLSLLGVLGCAAKELPLPAVQPVPPVEDVAAFQAPSLYVPPPRPQPALPSVPSAPGVHEHRLVWEEGKAERVEVQVGYPTFLKMPPTEKLTLFIDGDREYLSEGEAQAQPQPQTPQHKNDQCFFGPRWQYCRGVSGHQGHTVEHLVITASHVGHKTGLLVLTDVRSYYVELLAVKTQRPRLISWDVPVPLAAVQTPPEPTLFPHPAEARVYHVGYDATPSIPTPEWAPLQVLSDVASRPSAKMYVQLPPVVSHQRLPLLRCMNRGGKPYLCNSRVYANWVVVDELADRLELRKGAGEEAEVVVITRGSLHAIHCPGDRQCPRFPE